MSPQVAILREPVARVISEYFFCTWRRNCVVQEQWDLSNRRESGGGVVRVISWFGG